MADETKVKIIIACMDPRLNARIDELAQQEGGNFIIVRNAGGDLGSLRETLQSIIDKHTLDGIESVYLMQHEDCAADDHAKNILKGEERAPNKEFDAFAQRLGDRFRAKSIDSDGLSLEQVDAENKEMQEEMARTLFESDGKDRVITTWYAQKDKLPPKSHSHSAVLISSPDAFAGRYGYTNEVLAQKLGVELGGMYTMAAQPRNLKKDVGLLHKLDFKDMNVIVAEKTSKTHIKSIGSQIRAQGFENEHISFVGGLEKSQEHQADPKPTIHKSRSR